jgi:hypothetical protein
VRLIGLVVLPLPFVVFVKLTVSLYVPATRLLAALFIDTVIVALAPAPRVPLAGVTVNHAWVFAAIQSIDVPPVFCSV